MSNPTLISIINLGCTKNLVDSQFLLGKFLSGDFAGKEGGSSEAFQKNPPFLPSPSRSTAGRGTVWKGVVYCANPYDNEVEWVLLNTCGFISSGREEALKTMKKLLKRGKKVCITGCAVKYWEELADDEEWKKIKNQVSLYPWNELNKIFLSDIPKALTNLEEGFEYLKIAEGCNNSCAFCIIPQIRWRQISLPIPKLVREVENLVQQGAKEIILIAQDSTRYGVDLYGKPQLFELLEEIEVLEGDFRYRVLYLYPDLLTLKQLEKLTGFQKFIPYFDIPLQHSAGSVLKRMGRFYDEKSIHKFLHFIKTAFPLYFIRTNFIIGFPGETEEEFEHLKAFIKLNYFDNIALFEYHDEPLAKSFQLSGKVEEKVIRRRFHELHQLVNQLSINHSQARKGKEEWGWVVEVPLSLGDVAVEKGKVWMLVVRPWLHCPEIDEVDEVLVEQVLACEGNCLEIWRKISYIV